MKEIMHNRNERNNKGWLTINVSLITKQLIEEFKTKNIEERIETFAKFQKKDIQTEQEAIYAKLRPQWLDHAPKITQEYRKELEKKAKKKDRAALKEMEFFQWKFSYNVDGTVNLIKLEWGKTFCADITGTEKRMHWDDARQLAHWKWYYLLTDWSGSESKREKRETDWYKLEQYFGKYAHTWAITHMLGCVPGRYWTDNTYENEKGACIRMLLENDNIRYWTIIKDWCGVCGFKKMNTAT